MICHLWPRTCYDQPIYKFEISISISIHYNDMKGDTKGRKWGDLV